MSWCANVLIPLLFLIAYQCPAQRILQYHLLPSLTNPAAMGESKTVDVGLAGQYGLYGFDGGPQTVALSATIPFLVSSNSSNKRRGGRGAYRAYREEETKKNYIGLSAVGSQVGVHQDIAALAGYGHKIQLGAATYLTFAFTSGVQMQLSNYAKAVNEYVADPAILQRIENSRAVSSFVWQVGAYLQGKAYYFSLFTASVFTPEYCYQIGWRSRREHGWNIDISTLGTYFERKQQYRQDINLMLRYNEGLGIGASYRTQKDIACMASIKLGQLRLGYAYQIFNFDKLLPTHEIVLKYTVGTPKEL